MMMLMFDGNTGRHSAGLAQGLQPPALLVKERWLPVLRGGASDGAGAVGNSRANEGAELKIAALLREAVRDGRNRLRRGGTDEEILDAFELQVRGRALLRRSRGIDA